MPDCLPASLRVLTAHGVVHFHFPWFVSPVGVAGRHRVGMGRYESSANMKASRSRLT